MSGKREDSKKKKKSSTYCALIYKLSLLVCPSARTESSHHVSVLHGSLRSSRCACWRPLQAFVLSEQDVHGGQQHFRQVVAYLGTQRTFNKSALLERVKG